MLETINLWAVLVSTVLAFVLGGLWYGPVFGKAWMAAMGFTEEDVQPTPTPFIVSFFTALITALTLAWGMALLAIADPLGGAAFGLVVGVGFIATAMASDTAFCGWGMKLWLIQAGYRVTYSVLMGVVIGLWP